MTTPADDIPTMPPQIRDLLGEQAFNHLARGRPQDAAILLARGADAVRVFSAKMSVSPRDAGKNSEQVGQDHRPSAVQGDSDGVISPSRNPSLITAGSD